MYIILYIILVQLDDEKKPAVLKASRQHERKETPGVSEYAAWLAVDRYKSAHYLVTVNDTNPGNLLTRQVSKETINKLDNNNQHK